MKIQTNRCLNAADWEFPANRPGQRPRPRRIQTGHLPAGSSRPARHAIADSDARDTEAVIKYKNTKD